MGVPKGIYQHNIHLYIETDDKVTRYSPGKSIYHHIHSNILITSIRELKCIFFEFDWFATDLPTLTNDWMLVWNT